MLDSLHVRRLTPRIALAVAFVAMLTAGNAVASNTTITLDGTPITATTTTAGEKAGISFTGTAGHRVSVRISSSSVTNYTIALKAPDGSIVKTSGTWGVAGGFMGPVTLPAQTGTYKFIITPASTLKGKWTVAAWDVPADATGAITTDGTQTTQTYSAPGQNGTLTFSGTVGQRISFLAGSGVTTTAKNVTVSIKAPSGATVLAATPVGTGGMFFDPMTLAENGTYTISVNPPKYTTGTTAYQLWTVPADQTGTLTLGGGAQALTFNTPGQNASYTFTGTSGQKVTFSATSSSLNSTIKIKKPDGTLLSTLTTVSTVGNSGALMEPTTLPATGTYTVTVDPTAQATGSVTINAYVSPADLSGTLTSGTPTTATFATVGQNASYTISGTAGQYLAVRFDQDTISSAKVNVLTPANATLGSDTGTIGTTGKFFDGVVLPTTGTYKVTVDPQGTYTGSVNVTAYVYSNPSTQAATLGTPLVVTTVPGQNAQITFTAAAKDSIQFSNVTAGSPGATGIVATLYQGSTQIGSPWTFGNNGLFIDTMSLTNGVTYKLLLDPQGQNSGSVTTTIYSVPADATTTATVNTTNPGTAASLSIGTPGQNGSITFSGTTGHSLSMSFSNVTIGNAFGAGTTVTLLSPSNATVTSFTLNAHDTFIEPVALTSTGTYTLKFDPSGNFTGGFNLNLYDVPADATGTATINGTTQTATTVVPGQNMQVSFTESSTSPITVSYDVTSDCVANLSLYKGSVSVANLVTNWGQHFQGDTMPAFTPVAGTNTYVVKVDPLTTCVGGAVVFVTQ